MKKFIFLSFAFLAWSFYVMSDGADFRPPVAPVAVAQAKSPRVDPAPRPAAIAAAPRVESAPAGIVLASLASPAEPAPKPEPARTVMKLDPAKAASLTRPEPAPTPAAAPEPEKDLRVVSGSRVNMRTGPGREFGVVETLDRGAQVEVLRDEGTGWVKLRTEGGRVGWMADFLLDAPQG